MNLRKRWPRLPGAWGLVAVLCLAAMTMSCTYPFESKGKPWPVPVRSGWKDLVGFPVAVGGRAYALEKVECSDASGDWVLLYEGIVTELSPDSVRLRLEKRYGYRFHPDKEGTNPTDWWCIPQKRHCYAEVGFGDWGGPHARGDIVSFPKDTVFDAGTPLATILENHLRRQCHH